MGIVLSKTNYKDFQKYCSKNNTAIIPTGSCEQHGLHLPLGTDFLIAEKIAEYLVSCTETILCPTIPYGHSSNHERFPGTVTIDPRNYAYFIQDIIKSLSRHGIKKIVFINGHSGNTHLLQEGCNLLRDQKCIGCIVNWWELTGILMPEFALSGHGDYLEGSAVMALYPNDVKASEGKEPADKFLTNQIKVKNWQKIEFKNANIITWVKSEDGSDYGNFGSLKNMTRENGEKVLKSINEFLKDFINEFAKIDTERLV